MGSGWSMGRHQSEMMWFWLVPLTDHHFLVLTNHPNRMRSSFERVDHAAFMLDSHSKTGFSLSKLRMFLLLPPSFWLLWVYRKLKSPCFLLNSQNNPPVIKHGNWEYPLNGGFDWVFSSHV
jgi:hypothetical protein